MIQQNPRASRAPRAKTAATTTTTRPATRSTARRTKKAKRTRAKANSRPAKRNETGLIQRREALTVSFSFALPQVQPAAVGERVGVALALLAVVFAVLVARAVAALAAIARERAPARDGVVLVQMTAVPADPVVHFPHPRNVFGNPARNIRQAPSGRQAPPASFFR